MKTLTTPPPSRQADDAFSGWINPSPLIYSSPADSLPRRPHPLGRADLVLAVCLFAAALVVRWPLISRGETLLHSDEAIVGIMSQDIAAGRSLPIFFYGQRYMGALEAYVAATISYLVSDPIIALRLAPALFFALFVAVQYLMLSHWFARRGGLVGAFTLLAASPMFAQWSISARGGYIEILLWGSLLLWGYMAWFGQNAESLPPAPANRRRLALGLLVGSGMWINPAIVLFVVPIFIHMFFGRPLNALRGSATLGPRITQWSNRLGIATMPLVGLAAILAFNCIWSVNVSASRVQTRLLLGLVPPALAMGILVVAAAAIGFWLVRHTRIVATGRMLIPSIAPLFLGLVLGAAPAILYVAQSILGLREMDPSLPLGLRPIWTLGATIQYFASGIPLLFGADARPFLDLVTIGRPDPFIPLNQPWPTLVACSQWLVLAGLACAVIAILFHHRSEIGDLLRLKPGLVSPPILLVLGAATTILLYLFSGAAHDFNTIRYLIPLWVFVPGLIAAATSRPTSHAFARFIPLLACVGWSIGQLAMIQQLGRPHPLRPVADALLDQGIASATAEIFDAHLLSFLTQQKCRVVEYEPFWARLAHYRPLVKDAANDYIVQTRDEDVARQRAAWSYPGHPPPETTRTLWPRLRRAIEQDPGLLISRRPLAADYELVRLSRPLPGAKSKTH